MVGSTRIELGLRGVRRKRRRLLTERWVAGATAANAGAVGVSAPCNPDGVGATLQIAKCNLLASERRIRFQIAQARGHGQRHS